MDLSTTTKKHIEKTTGVAFSDLLDKKVRRDNRLDKLVKCAKKEKPDYLVRGNPQLTLGRITTMDEVEKYFSEKLKYITNQGE